MIKRLIMGSIKGLLVGGGIGALFHYGAHWTHVSTLLGFLLAMGVAGTTGIFAGRPPWQEGAWIEAILKGLVGVGIGALVYWGLTYIPFTLSLPGMTAAFSVAELPLLFAPVVACVYGALVELDNTDDDNEETAAPAQRARVVDVNEYEVVEVSGGRTRKHRRKA